MNYRPEIKSVSKDEEAAKYFSFIHEKYSIAPEDMPRTTYFVFVIKKLGIKVNLDNPHTKS